jgi:hypothetical protein
LTELSFVTFYNFFKGLHSWHSFIVKRVLNIINFVFYLIVLKRMFRPNEIVIRPNEKCPLVILIFRTGI